MKSPGYSDISGIIEKAKDAINAAVYDLEGGFFTATANRAYYSCFYCMTALLYTVAQYSKTHSGTKTKFLEHFVRTGIFPESASDIVVFLYENRQAADYEFGDKISSELAADLIDKAKMFFQLTTQYFESKSHGE